MNTQDKILAAQTTLLWDQPFFGVLMLQLKKVQVDDASQVNTMATDGRHLYYHPPFVDGLKKDELVFVLAHEVMHNALEHHIRRQHRKPGRWNKAADYAINGELDACKVGRMPDCGLIEARFTGLSAEEIYRILDDENNGDDSDEGQGDIGGCGGTMDGCAPHDEAAKAELRAEMQTQIRQAAMTAKAVQQGNVPANIQRIIDELLAPRVDWRAVLRRFIDESSTRDFSWARPNRRMLPMGIITPGTVPDGVSHIVIAVDTSGSIDNATLNAFAAEVRGAFEEGAVDKIDVVYCDASINHTEQFEIGDELVIRAVGGGGTRFSPVFEWVQENAAGTRLVIYLTDLCCNDFGDEPDCPVIWAHYGTTSAFNQLSPNVPWGECVHIEP